MKVSILCVTENRPEFMPWLLWNYQRQKWPDKELIVVDSSEQPTMFAREHSVRVIHAPGANVPAKRNIARIEATGDFITWLDDDDWRHPDWLNQVTAVMDPDTAVSGGRVAWFVNAFAPECRRFIQRRGVLFVSVLVDRTVAEGIPFNEAIERGSDLDWMERLLAACDFTFTYEAPSLFLCHDRNMGNTTFAHYFNRPLSELAAEIGKKAWGDTEKQIGRLAAQLQHGN